MMLTRQQFADYSGRFSSNQAATVIILRNLLAECEPGLDEHVNEGKWLNGYLFYTVAKDQFIYAIGPTAQDSVSMHLMTLYGSAELRDKYKDELKGLVSGKSCLKFKNSAAIPEATLREILPGGAAKVLQFYEMRRKK